MFENLSIRSKIIAIIAAPVVVLLVVSGIGAFQRRASAANSQADERIIAVTQSSVSVASALGVESVISATPGAAGGPIQAKVQSVRQSTDRATSNLDQQLDNFESGADAGTKVEIDDVRNRLSLIGALRRAIDSGQSTSDLLNNAYPSAISETLALPTQLLGRVHNPQVAAQMRSILALSRYQASVAVSNARLAPFVATGSFPDETSADTFRRTATEAETNKAIFEANASPASNALLRNALSGASVDLVDAVYQGARTSSVVGNNTDVAAWSAAVQEKLQRIDGVGQKLAKQLRDEASARSSDATRSANLFILVALLAAAVAVTLAWMLARAITRPLGKLTAAANELSTEQLPRLVDGLRNPGAEDVEFLRSSVTTLDVRSQDEVGQLADAFNNIQQVAVDVATEQSELLRKGIGDMFVNLARRNQSLLDRQIEFIDELETNEEDPDQLQHLFHLDHLATRMRRNAESLLVLAGAEPNRRRGRPVSLTDVVRAALGEVEDFARIDLLELEDVLVTSNASADVAHLLSELMENATNFSPPDTRVEVVGHRTKADGYTVSISDTGIGMSPEQLAEANDTLANPPLVGLAMSRSLGFIVIGRLAARFGISVRLMASPAGGVTAVVSLPGVIIHELPTEAPVPTPELVDEDVDAGAERWTPQVVDSGSALLPPLEFTPFDPSEAPASFEEAVPGGRAFEDGVAGLVDESGPSPTDRPEADRGQPEVSEEDAPHLPALGAAKGSVDDAEGAAARPRLFGPGPRPATTAGPSAEPASTNGGGLPSRRSPDRRQAATELPEPLPGQDVAVSASNASAGPDDHRGDLLEPAAADTTSGPEPLPAVEPARLNSRLFGQVGAAASPPMASDGPDGSPAPLPSRGRGDDGATPAGGLARRAPRSTKGGSRPRPGGEDADRQGVVATKRSPDEVRSLLSDYRRGATKAKSTPDKTPDAPNPEGDA